MAVKPLDALTRLEALAERWLEGGFTRLFRTRLHHAELEEQLARALEDGCIPGPNGVWLAPDVYQVLLSLDDYVRLNGQQKLVEIEHALASYLMKVAQRIRATLTRRPEVHLAPSERVLPRHVEVRACLSLPRTGHEPPLETREFRIQKTREQTAVVLPESSEPSPVSYLLHDDRRFLLTASPISLGRSLDNDVVIEHPRISRHHAQLGQRDDQWWLIDLNSANGTAVNDQLIREAVLQPGDVISLAGVEIRFGLEMTGTR